VNVGPGVLRRDPLTGAWTVVAPRREARPHDAGDGAGRRDEPAGDCPFCEGHEHLTPPEVDALRPGGGPPDSPGWRVRVVPNKFPVLEGGHEVVIHSPRHDVPLHRQPLSEVTDVVAMYQRRIAALCGAGAAAVTVILNQGRAAGASLAHPHSQVFATPIVPPVLIRELEQLRRHELKYGRCLLCDLIGAVVGEGSLLLFDGPVVAWTPDAARWPYELRLAPAAHEPDVLDADPRIVAAALRRALGAIAAATADAPLNAWLHTAPCAGAGGPDDEPRPSFHWHVEVAPRLATLAGFELGTGIGVATVEPSVAAARLRAALPAGDE
jgi:UDPglucose--hexose-1-phosphate uridylyltransferase